MIVDIEQLTLVVKALLAIGAATALYHMAVAIIQLIDDWRRDEGEK